MATIWQGESLDNVPFNGPNELRYHSRGIVDPRLTFLCYLIDGRLNFAHTADFKFATPKELERDLEHNHRNKRGAPLDFQTHSGGHMSWERIDFIFPQEIDERRIIQVVVHMFSYEYGGLQRFLGAKVTLPALGRALGTVHELVRQAGRTPLSMRVSA